MSSMQMDSQQGDDRIRGVFSSQEIRKVGTGTTTRKTVQKTFWFAEQEADGSISLQALNTKYVPTGPKKIISREDLIVTYSPEPEFYIQSVYPKMREMDDTLDRADEHRTKGETFSAEHEYTKALEVDEENVRANFGIGLTYLERGETDKADNIFGRLVNLDAAFQPEHKHLFNDFGINLRKNKMYRQSVDYYSRALELTAEDENLHINMARALLEEKNYMDCTAHLLSALRLEPGSATALKFLEWMNKQKFIPAEYNRAVQEVLSFKDAALGESDTPDTGDTADDTPGAAKGAAAR